MRSSESKIGRIIFARLYENEDLIEVISKIAEHHKIKAAFLNLIGTLKNAKLGFYHRGKYETIEVKETLEIVSCIGNMSIKEENELVVHAHLSVSNRKGETFGGHLLAGNIVAVTAELTLIEATDISLNRKLDEETKLFLWSFE